MGIRQYRTRWTYCLTTLYKQFHSFYSNASLDISQAILAFIFIRIQVNKWMVVFNLLHCSRIRIVLHSVHLISQTTDEQNSGRGKCLQKNKS